ncbi:hypothetical protein [Streptomyces sp. NPDC001123]
MLTDPKQAPRGARGKGKALDSCSYTSGDGTAMLTLNHAAELSAAHSSATLGALRDARAERRRARAPAATAAGVPDDPPDKPDDQRSGTNPARGD